MIKSFEAYTYKITYEEKWYILPRLIKILSLAIGNEKAITNNQILRDINITNPIYTDSSDVISQIKSNGPRIRHLIHVIRVNDIIPYLIATSKGYYISNDMDEVNDYIESLEDRVKSIANVLRALRKQVRKYDINKQPVQGTLIF